MPKSKIFVAAFFGVCALLNGLSPVHARDRVGAKARDRDFYADALMGADTTTRPTQNRERSGDCFVTLNAREVARGIRHWSGKC